MSRPAIGEPDPGRASPPRTGFPDAATGILVLLALGLIFRLIIAYALPGSGFRVDLDSFRFWANNLADFGISGFYARAAAPEGGFFADYTPGYLYVLWLVGTVGNVFGGIGDLIKVPPVLGDVALAYLVWSMTRELGGSERSARIGAAVVLINPVTWFDSVLWGQVDSVGVVVLLLALRELWRDRPERAAVLAALAAIIKPQLGILIPIVAIVVIRRAFWPTGGYGAEDEPDRGGSTTSWERRVRGPIRIITTGAAGFLTALALSVPFGLSLPGLVAQVFKTAGGYPYLSVNAYNPWALVSKERPDGGLDGIAVNRQWVCDATIVPSGPTEFRIGPFVIPEWSSVGSTIQCLDGFMVGPVPAAFVGAAMFLVVAAIVLFLVARRPDRLTMLVGVTVLALAFFVLPTRVHERYLFPFVALGAILAAVSLRWRIAYVLASAAMLANMYAVLTYLYPGCGNPGAGERCNPNIADWLGIGETLTSYWGVAIAALTQAAVLGWAFFQLRRRAIEGLEDDVVYAGRTFADEEPDTFDDEAPGRLDAPDPSEPGEPSLPAPPVPSGPSPLSRWTSAFSRPTTPAHAAAGPMHGAADADAIVVRPEWDDPRDTPPLGPLAWFRARLADRPVRADRSQTLAGERGGRLDRLDLWILAVLAVSLLTVRMWRLDEPYQMHFDEVYHPRTATEFLQDWRYGLSHDIYEWTHPHLAKYAMALGIVAFGEDRVGATSQLGVPVVDAVIEPRRDSGQDASKVEGDRLWVATGSEVRAYDLPTRVLVATVALPDAIAVEFDRDGQQVYAATRSGEVRVIDTTALDASRRGPPISAESAAFMDIGEPIASMFLTRDGSRLAVVLAPDPEAGGTASTIVIIDADAATELARPAARGVTQISDMVDSRMLVATDAGVAFVDSTSGEIVTTLDVGGPVHGVVGINDIQDDPIYATAQTAEGPKVAVIIAKPNEAPRVHVTSALPGDRAGRAYFDVASRMVHVEGSVPATTGVIGSSAAPGTDTIYVLEPHGPTVGQPPMIYADAPLPYRPSAIVMDDNQQYQWADRQQLLAFDSSGQVASVEIGRHAFAWRVPGVVAGVLMALLLYVLARLLFRRRTVAVILGLVVLVDGMLFAQSRIGMNDSYVGLGIIGAYTVFAALWLHPGNSRRHWVAFALGVPLIGAFLGFALAAKWVAAYAIGGLGILALIRSALGRLLVIGGLVGLTTALGYVAISVAPGETGGNYVFLGIMVALIVIAVLANVLHPVAWTWEEVRFAIGAPIAAGLVAIVYGLSRGDAAARFEIGPVNASAVELGFLALLGAGAIYAAFIVAGRLGFGPFVAAAEPDDVAAMVEPPAEAPRGWLRLGSGFGLPAVWLAVGLLVVPIGLYVLSYVPWAFVENHRIVDGWPAGHAGQTLLELTKSMYDYHNDLPSPHPASSPWWAWAFDLKPVWFYEEGFAGRTSASIYDAGNLVAWWLAVPALGFVVWQAFRRRSPALALIAIAFAVQWISWARIDRAAFQYHYYTSLPFVFLALAYFLAELWHGPSRRTWLLARLSAGAAVLGPFLMYLFHRPLCAIVRVTEVNENSQACPTLIPEVTITPRAVAMAVVIGVGVLLLLRELLSVTDEEARARSEARSGGSGGVLARIGLSGRWATTVVIAVGTSIAFVLASTLLNDAEGIKLTRIPVEPLALVVTLALTPVAAYVATARDSRRFVLGALGAMVFWFVLWYPNIAALPLPVALHNAYQGFLPTYLYPFQFWVATTPRPEPPSLFALGPAIMFLSLGFTAIVVGYSAWSWRIALAERRRDRLAASDEPPPSGANA